ncbi:MAG TPA: FkbM family methyltransferase [Candidatus Acidoferrum sp.]|nr:FkbM family methyltransferase [Candidatus Acidoferrum sp.]
MQKRIARELRPGAVFYDVGANVGFYSLLASALVAPSPVYAFEPLPTNASYLRKHLELNRIRNVELFELAISDETRTAFFTTEETRAMGKLEPGGNLSVQTATLDALLREQRLAPPDFIKMDIEGEEYRALQGAKECFSRHRPKLFLATHGRKVHDVCCDLLAAWSYEWEYTSSPSVDRAELVARPSASSAS